MQDAINALGGADERKLYMTIGKGGTFRLQVEPGTKGAKTRTYEVDGDNGEKITKSKTEIHKSLLKDVLIKDLNVYNGNFGESVNADVTIGGMDFCLQFKSESSFGMDFMEKIGNVDLTKPMNIRGYDFEDEKGKRRKGISIEQDGEKVTSYFYDSVAKKSINGIPETTGEGFDSKKWRRFFEDKAEFLVAFIKSDIIPKVASTPAQVEDVLETEVEDNDEQPF